MHGVGFDAGLRGDGARGDGVVAGQHQHADAGLAAFLHRLAHTGAQRIGQRHQAQPLEGEGGRIGGPLAVLEAGLRHGQHAQAACAHGLGLRMRGGALFVAEPAQCGHGFRRALGGHAAGVFAGQSPDMRHRHALGREAVFVHQFATAAQRRGWQVFSGQRDQRAVHRVEGLLLAGQLRGFEQGVEGLRQRHLTGAPAVPLRVLAPHQFGHRHAVLGQRAGLVGGQHGGRAERLDHRGAPRQHALARQPPGAHRHEDGEDEHELLGQHRHRQRDAGQQAGQPVAALRSVEQHHQRAQRQAGEREQAHQRADLRLQRRGRAFDRGQRAADAAEGGGRPGGVDARQPPAAGQQRAGEDAAGVARAGLLGHRQRFAAEQRFVGLQVVRLDQRRIGGDAVAFAQHQQVAAHHLAPGDAQLLPVADHQRTRAAEIAQRLERALAAALLHHGDRDRDQHEDQQHRRLAVVAEQQVEQAGGDQQAEHRFARDLERDAPGRAPLRRRQLVGAVCGQARGGLGRAQPMRRVGICVGHGGALSALVRGLICRTLAGRACATLRA